MSYYEWTPDGNSGFALCCGVAPEVQEWRTQTTGSDYLITCPCCGQWVECKWVNDHTAKQRWAERVHTNGYHMMEVG